MIWQTTVKEKLQNMKKLFTKFFKGEKQLSINDLILVLVILGIVAIVAVPNMISHINKSGIQAEEAELHEVLAAVAAAQYEGKGMVIEYKDRQIIADSEAELNDPARYITKDTIYKYSITWDCEVTQGALVEPD